MYRVGLLGAGSWGTAIARILLDNGHRVVMYGRDQAQIETLQKTGINTKYMPGHVLAGAITFTTDIEEAMRDIDYLVNSVPTQSIRRALALKPTLDPKVVIINVSKGIEIGTNLRISEIFKSFYPDNPYTILSGPSHAEEVVQQMPTTLVAACVDQKISETVQDIFMTDYLRVYAHPDVKGVELAGSIKNIVALAAGICDGMGFGDNAIAALITRGIAEIKRLGLAMGARPQTFDGLAGIGDLIVTCTSPHSRNRRCGQLIGKGFTLDEAIAQIGMAVEGAFTLQAAYALKNTYGVDMPIVEKLYQVLYEGHDARVAVKELMTRQKKHEIEELMAHEIWS